MKKLELLAASALAIAVATPAYAQTQSSDAPAASQDDYQSANDIVVTATRRDETVQEVPVAITAIGNETLDNAGVTDIRGLEQLAPSLQTTTGQSSANATSLSIRGIGTAGDNPGFEPAVGTFIDGVFRARAGIAVSELPELQRVEVLRGPQGTLFGRNTSAGALSIYTAQPQFDFGGYVEGTYGNYNAYTVKGALTGPVAESFALRVDAGYRKRDGYIQDANVADRQINNIDRFYVRGQALYDTSTFSVRLIGDYSETDEQCCGAVSIQRGALAPAIQGVAALRGLTGLYVGNQYAFGGASFTTNPEQRIEAISPNRSFAERVKDWGASAEINADIGDLKLTSITAYRDWRAVRDQDIDFSGIDRAYRTDYTSELKDFTQEVRLQGSLFDDKVDFLLGGFYLNEKNSLFDTVRLGNDANQYVDFVLGGALAAPPAAGGIGRQAQFFGTFNVPTFQQLAASFQGGPALPAGTVPLFSQLLYLQTPALQQAAPPGSALFTYFNTPLTGAVAGQGNTNFYQVNTDAWALFTHNIINFTDELSLTLGLRYNHERKEIDTTISNNTGTCAFFYSADPRAVTLRNAIRTASSTLFANLFLLGCNPAVNTEFNGNYTGDRTENKFTGTAKLSYKITPDVLAYGSYDRGYKSGGYNMDQASFDTVLLGGNGPQITDLEFGEETVNAYEVGLKTRWGRAFTFNIAAFYQKFEGLQSLVFSGNNFVVQNVPKATSKGIEAEAVVQPQRNLTFNFGYTYLDAKYDESNDFTGTPLQGSEGEQFANQPKHVVTLAGTFTPRIANGWNLLLHSDARYNSDVNISGTLNAGGQAPIRNPGYILVAARLGVQSEDRTKSLEFWVENLTNTYYNITGFAVPEQTGNYAGYPGLPRFYGVTARFGF